MGDIQRQLDRILNLLFGSRYNPLYRAGQIAVTFFVIASTTGLYLCFFYRLGDPYTSILDIQNSVWIGRWVRSLHRYSSDGMIVAVIFHVLRMFAEKKTFGPRTLAWISGVFLLVLTWLTGWTGFVLVWDEHAQALAVAGARIFDSLGVFPDSIGRSFSGETDAAASFFFLNLFLHIVIPLGMIFGLWFHTSKIAAARWFPEREILIGLGGLLIGISVLYPAPLGDRAHLLSVPARYPLDLFFNFWIVFADENPFFVFLGFTAISAMLGAVPWLLKPRAAKRPSPSFNDPKICQGCSQCVEDCPYDAISMMDLAVDEKMKNVATVRPDLCVSCGLCSGACAPITMGPEGLKGGDQLAAAKAFLAANGQVEGNRILIVTSGEQTGVTKRLRRLVSRNPKMLLYEVDCTSIQHVLVYEALAPHFSAVVIAGCPSGGCSRKEGPSLLRQRLSGEKEPTFRHHHLREKVHLFEVGEGEESWLISQADALLKGRNVVDVSIKSRLTAMMAGGAVLVAIAALTRWSSPPAMPEGILRLSIRLPAQSQTSCRPLTPEEARAPKHMQPPNICEHRPLKYRLKLTVADILVLDEEIHPGGWRRDRPIYVNKDIKLTPHEQSVHLSLLPDEEAPETVARLLFEGSVNIRAGTAALLYYSPESKEILLKGGRNE